jgi:hypothetical protein
MYKILDSAELHRWFGKRLALAVPEPRDSLKRLFLVFIFGILVHDCGLSFSGKQWDQWSPQWIFIGGNTGPRCWDVL